MFDSSDNGRRSKILLVDENTEAVEALSLLLEMEGFEVSTAHNGLEALEQLKNDRISVILLDLWMPVMNGSEFLHRKAEIETIADIPVIVLSANPPWERPEGTQAVFQKPVYPEGLLETIKRYIS